MILRGLLLLALLAPWMAMDARAQAARPSTLYVVALATVPTIAQRPSTPIPAALRSKSLYWRVLISGNRKEYQLCLGFYNTRAEAERAQRQLVASFRQARVIAVRSKERDDLQKATPRAAPSGPAKPSGPSLAPPPVPSTKLPPVAAPAIPAAPAAGAALAPEPPAAPSLPPGAAESLMDQGRAAITREDYGAAIRLFTQLLALNENPLQREAQELLGLSYERAGQTARARLEYEKYLKRYPQGDDSVRVRQRLVNLRAAPPQEALRAPTVAAQGWRSLTFGSVSQFYYRGNSKIDTQQQTVVNTLDRTTLSLTDQSALISSLDLSARFLNDTHDNRLVFRDTSTKNFIEGQNSYNRLYAAYYDYRYKPQDFSARLGRQPGSSGGLPGRFDGALFGYGLFRGLRVNAVGGAPVDQFNIDSSRRFYGISTDLGPFDQHWGGSLYSMRQTVDHIPDREASGLELRYFSPQGFFATTVEYDTLFRHTNIATMQGNWLAPWKTSFNFLADYRMTPALQTSTAVIGEATTSIRTLLQTYTEEELRQRARALTAESAFASAGFMHPVSKVWQLGADYRVSRISHTDGTNLVPGTPGSGPVHTLTGQAIGTGVLATRDIMVIALSRISAETYTGSAVRCSSRAPLGRSWTLDSALLWYGQNNDDGSDLRRVSPDFRLSYQAGKNVSLEVEVGVEDTNSQNATTQETTRRNFFSLGYRWDF